MRYREKNILRQIIWCDVGKYDIIKYFMSGYASGGKAQNFIYKSKKQESRYHRFSAFLTYAVYLVQIDVSF